MESMLLPFPSGQPRAAPGLVEAECDDPGRNVKRNPLHARMLEPSAELRERQQARLRAALPPELFALCEWLDGPPESEWRGVLFANEVLDALPTPRFVIHDGEVFE
jgi:SAM-dependent MidA family methyltransferase